MQTFSQKHLPRPPRRPSRRRQRSSQAAVPAPGPLFPGDDVSAEGRAKIILLNLHNVLTLEVEALGCFLSTHFSDYCTKTDTEHLCRLPYPPARLFQLFLEAGLGAARRTALRTKKQGNKLGREDEGDISGHMCRDEGSICVRRFTSETKGRTAPPPQRKTWSLGETV